LSPLPFPRLAFSRPMSFFFYLDPSKKEVPPVTRTFFGGPTSGSIRTFAETWFSVLRITSQCPSLPLFDMPAPGPVLTRERSVSFASFFSGLRCLVLTESAAGFSDPFPALFSTLVGFPVRLNLDLPVPHSACLQGSRLLLSWHAMRYGSGP